MNKNKLNIIVLFVFSGVFLLKSGTDMFKAFDLDSEISFLDVEDCEEGEEDSEEKEETEEEKLKHREYLTSYGFLLIANSFVANFYYPIKINKGYDSIEVRPPRVV